MKKKITSILLALLGLSISGFAILLFLGVFKEQQSGILIESDPISTIYIDNQEVGKTPYEATREAGEIIVRVKPDLVENVALDDYETKINLVPGVRTIIQRTFRQTEESSSGVVVSFEKTGGSDSFANIVSVPDNSQVLIDNKIYGYTPLRVKIPAGNHNLIVSSDKYLAKSLPIKIYAGFNLMASVKLAINEDQKLTKTPVQAVEKISRLKIRIDKTDTGFLRVRSGANIGFPEIAQVKPGEEYDVIEEGENGKWYKIKVGEVEGWVSGEFVTKILP